VTSLAIDGQGRLVATGLFRTVGGETVNGLAAWDGSQWSGFGAGFGEFEYGSRVIPDGDGFIVSGYFTSVDGLPISRIARWSGSAWSAVGDELFTSFGNDPVVSDVVRYGNGLFATGTFQASGSTEMSFVGWWDGAAWHPLGVGLNDLGERLLVSGTTLWVGGPFGMAGGAISSGIAAWDFAD